jgi:hypothetical protein
VASDAIQLRGLAKRFGDFHAVALFDLTVRAQTAFTLPTRRPVDVPGARE